MDTSVSATHEAKLPPELTEMAREYLGADPDALSMGVQEAREHRAKLMEARSAFVKTENWEWYFYS